MRVHDCDGCAAKDYIADGWASGRRMWYVNIEIGAPRQQTRQASSKGFCFEQETEPPSIQLSTFAASWATRWPERELGCRPTTQRGVARQLNREHRVVGKNGVESQKWCEESRKSACHLTYYHRSS
jgi:hypothetical protein